jgi:hypothetical protein
MEKHPKIRRFARVEITPREMMDCVAFCDSNLRKMYRPTPEARLEFVGEFFGDTDKSWAFVVRMQMMREMSQSPQWAEYSTLDPQTGKMASNRAIFHAAALAPIHYDDETQHFDEKEFFDIARLEIGAWRAEQANAE